MTETDSQAQAANRVVARSTGMGKFQQSLRVAGHALIADEPEALGGLGAGPSPYDFLAAGLAACTSMTIHLYAERKQLALPGYAVEVAHSRTHAADCASCLTGSAPRIDRFDLRIVFDAPIDAATEAKVLDIAGKCPVHRTLTGASQIVTTVASTA